MSDQPLSSYPAVPLPLVEILRAGLSLIRCRFEPGDELVTLIDRIDEIVVVIRDDHAGPIQIAECEDVGNRTIWGLATQITDDGDFAEWSHELRG